MSVLDDFYGPELAEKRKELIFQVQRLRELGLLNSVFGNVSVKLGKSAMLITPRSAGHLQLQEDDLTAVDLTGRIFGQQPKPSDEKHLHCSIYLLRSDIGAVVHVHSVYAGVFAAARQSIAPMSEDMAIMTSGEVMVAEFAPQGTQQLARCVSEVLSDHNAVLLANHGLVTVGHDLNEAVQTCAAVEKCAHISLLARLLGDAQQLSAENIEYARQVYFGH